MVHFPRKTRRKFLTTGIVSNTGKSVTKSPNS